MATKLHERRIAKIEKALHDLEDELFDAVDALRALKKLQKRASPRDSVKMGILLARVRWALELRKDRLDRGGSDGDSRGFEIPSFPVAVQRGAAGLSVVPTPPAAKPGAAAPPPAATTPAAPKLEAKKDTA